MTASYRILCAIKLAHTILYNYSSFISLIYLYSSVKAYYVTVRFLLRKTLFSISTP